MKISEQFYSVQGEGCYTGVPSYFIRFFGCSLQCQGFGQENPADPKTWKQPWKTIPIEQYKSIEELPQEVYEYGCDSVYSWSAKFKHLQKETTAEQVIKQMQQDLGANFAKLLTGHIHIVFTGGEPLMKFNQQYIREIIEQLVEVHAADYLNITFETNGTQEIEADLYNYISRDFIELTVSCSPKLLHTAGEKRAKAIKPEIIRKLAIDADTFFLKFVVANTDAAKAEFLELTEEFKWHTIYIMPEGPNKARVEDSSTAMAEFALKHGYQFSDRLHARLWDNKIGV